MPEMNDYSGEFDPGLTLQDFSKEALIRLLVSASKAYLGIDGVWTTLMRKKLGDRVAFDYDKEVWFSQGLALDMRRTMEPLRITGDDIATLFKYLQFSPGFAVIYVGPPPEFEPYVKFELKNENLGIMTVTHCHSLVYFERHQDSALQKLACEEIDLPAWKWLASQFNPNIAVTPLKLPPRKSKNKIACQWEFKLEE
ncbi:DUF6125 family protein [Chloroflexota bacterium]